MYFKYKLLTEEEKMVKKELVDLYMKYKKVNIFTEAKKDIEDFIEVMKIAFERDETLILRDFGTFEVKETKRKTAFNPRTGEEVECTPKKYIKFKVGKELEERINVPKKRGRKKIKVSK